MTDPLQDLYHIVSLPLVKSSKPKVKNMGPSGASKLINKLSKVLRNLALKA